MAKRVKGFDPWWKTKWVILAVVLVVLVAGFLFLRSRNKTSGDTLALRTSAYCELNRQFESLATTTGAVSASGAFDGPMEAMALLVEQAGPTLPEMKSNAPSEIRSDVGTVVSAVEDAAKGDRAEVTSPKFTKARARLGVYQGKSCQLGSGEGEG